jgi:hypothetical protein
LAIAEPLGKGAKQLDEASGDREPFHQEAGAVFFLARTDQTTPAMAIRPPTAV